MWCSWDFGASVFWQAFGAIATAVGTLTALWLATSSRRERQKELDAEYLAEARMVRVDQARFDKIQNPSQADPDVAHYMTWRFTHAGHEPLFDVHCEAWTSLSAIRGKAQSGAFHAICLPNADHAYRFRAPVGGGQDVRLAAWQIRWSDRHGIQWRTDSLTDRLPRKYDGTPPRPALDPEAPPSD